MTTARARRGTLAGQQVAGHELVRVLASGGMGEVYLARHLTLGIERAMKVIRTDLRARGAAHDRFVREAQVLARLHHNSIVHIIDFGELDNGWPFFVMEYIDGPNLDQVVEPGPMPLGTALGVLEQIAAALHYAHKLGVVHRDLKPSNVLLRDADVRQVKVIDFGLAYTDDVKRLTAEGQVVGSPLYMAPEQADGRLEVTTAVDIYSLACVAYTLLACRPPFCGRSLLELIAAHASEVAPRITALRPAAGVPRFLDDLLFACLAKNPADRPHCDELVGHLSRLVRERAGASPPPEPAPRVPTSAGAGSSAEILLDTPPPDDGTGLGAALVNQVFAVIGEIATHMSLSHRDVGILLREADQLRDKVTEAEMELALVESRIGEAAAHEVRALAPAHQDHVKRVRGLHGAQADVQRRLIALVEGGRRGATSPIAQLFTEMDEALAKLALLRKGTP